MDIRFVVHWVSKIISEPAFFPFPISAKAGSETGYSVRATRPSFSK